MSLCTLDQLKQIIGIGAADAEHDDVLTFLVTTVSASLAQAAGCPGRLEKCDAVDVLAAEPRTHTLWLRARPIVEIQEVRASVYGRFDEVQDLTEGTDFQVRSDLAAIHRISGYWPVGIGTVRVTWTGGWTPPDVYGAPGYVQGAGEVPLPMEITEAAVLQAAFWFARRDQLGIRSIGTQGGSFTSYAKDELLPHVERTMRGIRREMG